MESSLSLRSLERTLEELLLPTRRSCDAGRESTARSGRSPRTGRRLAVPRTGRDAARRRPRDPDRRRVRGRVRSGLPLPAGARPALPALRRERPHAARPMRSGGSTSRCALSARTVVIAGGHARDDVVARWRTACDGRPATCRSCCSTGRAPTTASAAPARARSPAPPRRRRRRSWNR